MRGDTMGDAHEYMLVFERGSSWVFELPSNGEIVIGRGEAAELKLRDHAVARRHATLRIDEHVVTVVDHGSPDGTFVNGERLVGKRPLGLGDSLAICSATLVLFESAPIRKRTPWREYAALRERFDEELERALRYQRSVAVLCGLLANSAARNAVIDALAALREFDQAAWVDATQLVILAPETGLDEADAMARRVRELLGPFNVRLGYAVCPTDGHDAESLIIRARAAAATGTTGAATSLRTYRVGKRNVIVADPAMARLYALVERLARVELPVLITGERGSGKELAATMLHERSRRHAKPFVATHAESELFGPEHGVFSRANGGTVFLDEIGDLPLAIQERLVRVLETKRVGERETDVRLVAATTRNLQDEVAAGSFRQDLLSRLNISALQVPPLRDRPQELGLLAELFLSEACQTAGRPTMTIDDQALELLGAYRWPGNVRELEDVMRHFAATVAGAILGAEHVGDRLGPAPASSAPTSPKTFTPIADEIRELEIRRMTQSLEAAGGNQTRAAELIGMPLRTFFTKMRQYNLRK